MLVSVIVWYKYFRLHNLKQRYWYYSSVNVNADDIVTTAPRLWWRRCLSTWRSGTKSHLETSIRWHQSSCDKVQPDGITWDLTAGCVGRTLAPPWTCLTPAPEEMDIDIIQCTWNVMRKPVEVGCPGLGFSRPDGFAPIGFGAGFLWAPEKADSCLAFGEYFQSYLAYSGFSSSAPWTLPAFA